MDGKYTAKGREVYRNPTRTKIGITMGFKVCETCEGLSDDAAQEIADALNMHMRAHPDKH